MLFTITWFVLCPYTLILLLWHCALFPCTDIGKCFQLSRLMFVHCSINLTWRFDTICVSLTQQRSALFSCFPLPVNIHVVLFILFTITEISPVRKRSAKLDSVSSCYLFKYNYITNVYFFSYQPINIYRNSYRYMLYHQLFTLWYFFPLYLIYRYKLESKCLIPPWLLH